MLASSLPPVYFLRTVIVSPCPTIYKYFLFRAGTEVVTNHSKVTNLAPFYYFQLALFSSSKPKLYYDDMTSNLSGLCCNQVERRLNSGSKADNEATTSEGEGSDAVQSDSSFAYVITKVLRHNNYSLYLPQKQPLCY